MVQSQVSKLPLPGTQMGGCGSWYGRGQMLTYRSCVYFPLKAKGSRSVQALMTRSWASLYFSRSVTGTSPYPNTVSWEVPRGNPATNLPPLSTSSMANSSATLTGGLYSARLLPNTMMAALEVRRVIAEAIRFGDGIKP